MSYFIVGYNIYLPYPPKPAGTDAFPLYEHAAEGVRLSDAARQTDFPDLFIGKPQYPFRMGDPHLLQGSDHRYAELLFEQPCQIVLADEEAAVHGFHQNRQQII